MGLRREKSWTAAASRGLDVLRRLTAAEGGQDLIEYALLVGLIAVTTAAIFPTTLMPGVSTIYSKISSSMTIAGG